MASAVGTLADAFVAANITTWTQTLVSPNDNLADLADGLPKLLALMGQVASQNGGAMPDWIALGAEAYGRVLGANPVTYGGISIGANGRPRLFGVPIFPIIPTTASGMNGDGDPFGWVGCMDAVGFAFQAFEVPNSLRRRDNGLLTLDLSFTYTYGLHDVANQMGELLNAVT
jgi:hypothetical protein